jgi:hypothetical protein
MTKFAMPFFVFQESERFAIFKTFFEVLESEDWKETTRKTRT